MNCEGCDIPRCPVLDPNTCPVKFILDEKLNKELIAREVELQIVMNQVNTILKSKRLCEVCGCDLDVERETGLGEHNHY